MQTLTARPEHVPAERVFDFDICADPRFTSDVQGSYAAALAEAPDIFWTPRNGGHWMVRRCEAINAIVKEPEVFSAREMGIPRVPGALVLIPLNLDPPENIPFRQALMPQFSPKAVRALEPKMRAWAKRIVGEVAGRGECDFVHDVASLFPVSIFMELMGMPLERLREYRDLSDEFFRFQHIEDLFLKNAARISTIIEDEIEAKRANPDAGLISHLLSVDLGDGRRMTADEMHRTCFLLFLGGMDTVANVIAFSYQRLAQDPALQARLAADPGLIPKFVEESLRTSGVAGTPRLVLRDCQRFGVDFKEGEMVLCTLPISGRDDRLNAEPMRFDIDRERPAHLAFSSGPHLCVGHNLARAEIAILTEEWLRAVPSFSLAPGERTFRAGQVLALESLPLRWEVG